MASFGCGTTLIGAFVLVPGIVFSAITAATQLPGLSGGDAPDQVDGIDPTLLDAYVLGAQYLDAEEGYEQCTGLRWQILAGIGSIESDHGATLTIASDGSTDPPMIGPRLDGSGVGGNLTPHPDTDGGRWDGDTEYDAAVGVTQHLPANWADYGVNPIDDAEPNPHNVYHSVASTSVELCNSAGGQPVDFTNESDLRDALYRYNPAWWYVDDVMAEIEHYDSLPVTPSAEGGSEAGHAAVAWAMDQLGKPYLWGGQGPDAFDCSGLTMKAWEAAGVSIRRVTTDQYNHGTRVDASDLQPGDLLFYDTSDLGAPGAPPTHVTLYAGDGKMVNAPSSGQVIRVDDIADSTYQSRFMGAVRPG